MPLYEFINTKTNEVFEESISLSEYDKYMEDNPHIKRHYSSAPAISYSGEASKGVLTRAGDGWKEVQDRIRSGLPPKDKHRIKTK